MQFVPSIIYRALDTNEKKKIVVYSFWMSECK